jgi:hypothetical protein
MWVFGVASWTFVIKKNSSTWFQKKKKKKKTYILIYINAQEFNIYEKIVI